MSFSVRRAAVTALLILAVATLAALGLAQHAADAATAAPVQDGANGGIWDAVVNGGIWD